MNPLEIGEMINLRRSFLHIRQEDLSAMSGVNMKTIQQVELGKGNPSIRTLEKLFSILGLEMVVQVKQPENG